MLLKLYSDGAERAESEGYLSGSLSVPSGFWWGSTGGLCGPGEARRGCSWMRSGHSPQLLIEVGPWPLSLLGRDSLEELLVGPPVPWVSLDEFGAWAVLTHEWLAAASD